MGILQASAAGRSTPSPDSPAPARRLLLVDDQPFFLAMGQTVLRAGGYEVRTAASGPEALRAARAAPPDAILLDDEMPGMDGYETCRRLKADPATAGIPVAMLTASVDPQLNRKAFQVGADVTILKAVSTARLLNMLQVVLTTARGRRTDSRAEVALSVEYEDAGGVAAAETANLSADGMFIKTPTPAAVGTILLLRFAVPGSQTWQCSARVVWTWRAADQHPSPPGMGLQFLDLLPEARSAIRAFIATQTTPTRPGGT